MGGALLAHKGMVVDTPVHGDQRADGNTGIGEQRLRRRHRLTHHEDQVLTAIHNRIRLRHQIIFSEGILTLLCTIPIATRLAQGAHALPSTCRPAVEFLQFSAFHIDKINRFGAVL
jgi:hypothetical protein